MEDQSLEELQHNLAEYQGQLQQVEQLLLLEPNNQEYEDLYNSITELIGLTEEVIKAQQSSAAAGPASAVAGTSSAGGALARQAGAASTSAATPDIITTAPTIQLSAILPSTVAQQIRSAQQKAALAGQAPPAWAIGAKCQAVYSLDGEWYEASVVGVTTAGDFVVNFAAYGNTEQVDRGNVRAPPEVEEVYRGVAAPTRKAVTEMPTVGDMPKWLEIKPTDDEKTRNKKKKLQKSWKSKLRFQRLDMETKQRQQSWLDFKTGKGAKRKAGFVTGALSKKGSMFSVPDAPGAKVGVIGSGKGMTDFQTRGRHDYAGADAR